MRLLITWSVAGRYYQSDSRTAEGQQRVNIIHGILSHHGPTQT